MEMRGGSGGDALHGDVVADAVGCRVGGDLGGAGAVWIARAGDFLIADQRGVPAFADGIGDRRAAGEAGQADKGERGEEEFGGV